MLKRISYWFLLVSFAVALGHTVTPHRHRVANAAVDVVAEQAADEITGLLNRMYAIDLGTGHLENYCAEKVIKAPAAKFLVFPDCLPVFSVGIEPLFLTSPAPEKLVFRALTPGCLLFSHYQSHLLRAPPLFS